MSGPCIERAFSDCDGREVVARWFTPTPTEGNWRCDWSIEVGGQPFRARHAIGVDSVQALMLSIQTVAAELSRIEPPVFWSAPEEGLGPNLEIPDWSQQ